MMTEVFAIVNKANYLHLAAQRGDLVKVDQLLGAFSKSDSDEYHVDCLDSMGKTPLFYASERGHVKVVKLLVSKYKANTRTENCRGQTPLFCACKWGRLDVVELLVSKYKADVSIRDFKGCTAVMMAALGGHSILVNTLIEKYNAPLKVKDKGSRTLLHYACAGGNINLVEYLLALTCKQGIEDQESHFDVDCVDSVGQTPLFYACREGHLQIVNLLLLEFQANAMAQDHNGRIAAMVAALKGHSEVVENFINEYSHCLDVKDKKRLTVFHYACAGGNRNLATTLIGRAHLGDSGLHVLASYGILPIKCDPTIRDHFGRTLLHNACSSGNVNLVKTLITKHKADVNAQDDQSYTPLQVAVLYDHIDVAQYLIKNFNTDASLLLVACSVGNVDLVKSILKKNSSYVKPLHIAAWWDKEEVVYTILHDFKHNFNVNIKDHLGRTPLHIACSRGHVRMAKNLIAVYNADVNAHDDQNDTPLHMAASRGNKEVILLLINEFNCDINVKGKLGRTILHCACISGNYSLIQLLTLEYKMDVFAKDNQDDTPLHVAALYNAEAAVLMFINDFGGDPNLKGHLGRTVLHCACISGNVSLVQALISKQADINAQDNQCNTPIHAAACYGQEEIVCVLIESNISGEIDRTLLHSACIGGNVSLVKRLILDHAANIHALDSQNNTPAHLAAFHNQEPTVLMLVNQFSFDPIAKGHCGRTLLHMACQGNNISLVRALISKYEVDIYSRDDNEDMPIHLASKDTLVLMLITKFNCNPNVKGYLGRTLLHGACIQGNCSLVESLCEVPSVNAEACDNDNNTPIHVAALHGKYKIVEILLKYVGNFGNLLHCACIGGNADIAELLILKYWDMTALDQHGNTPLQVAALNDSMCVVSLLIDYFCNPRITNHLTGWSLLHSACSTGSVNVVRTLVIRYNLKVNARDHQNNTPLHVAALFGKSEVVSVLINYFNSDPNDKGYLGRTSLHIACSRGYVNLVKSLIIEHKADIYMRDSQNYTPLQVAMQCNQIAVVLVLIREFVECASLLHTACSAGNVSIVRAFLMEHGETLTDLDDQNNTPLHVAALWGEEEVVSFILTEFKGSINSRGHLGRTPLHAACYGGHAKLAKYLIMEHSADINIEDDQSNTPLHVAALSGRRGVAFMLITEFNCDIYVKGHLGRTLLHSACIGGNASLVELLICDYHMGTIDEVSPLLHVAAENGNGHVVCALISHFKCDWNVKSDRTGWSLLHSACSGGNIDLVVDLLKYYGISIYDQDYENNTPLHVAASCNNVKLVSILLTRFDIDPNVRGHLGRTLLHIACSKGHASLVKTLIEKHDANVNIRDDQNYTPLQVAVSCNNNKVALYLIREKVTGTSLLHTACSVGNSNVVRTLLMNFREAIKFSR